MLHDILIEEMEEMEESRRRWKEDEKCANLIKF